MVTAGLSAKTQGLPNHKDYSLCSTKTLFLQFSGCSPS